MEKDEAKPIINAAKYEMEGALETFVSLDDPWTYRLDVASLKTNLGFVAVWQGKPKKARKMVRQLKEIEALQVEKDAMAAESKTPSEGIVLPNANP